MPSPAIELTQVIEAIRHAFPLRNLALPDEFFPAHLSVALIDAVFGSTGKHNDVPASERYCRRVRMDRTRADLWNQPLPEAQETLTDMIGRFDEPGGNRMVEEVFRTKQLPPETRFARVRSVLRVARELQRAGVEVLQDVQARPSGQIERTLRDSAGVGEAAARLFFMYAGSDDFVCADVHVRQFVANALGRTEVSATRAEGLVRCSAYELALSPRYLDDQIWRGRSIWSAVA